MPYPELKFLERRHSPFEHYDITHAANGYLGHCQVRDRAFTVSDTDDTVLFVRQFPLRAPCDARRPEEADLPAVRHRAFFKDDRARFAYLRIAAQMFDGEDFFLDRTAQSRNFIFIRRQHGDHERYEPLDRSGRELGVAELVGPIFTFRNGVTGSQFQRDFSKPLPSLTEPEELGLPEHGSAAWFASARIRDAYLRLVARRCLVDGYRP